MLLAFKILILFSIGIVESVLDVSYLEIILRHFNSHQILMIDEKPTFGYIRRLNGLNISFSVWEKIPRFSGEYNLKQTAVFYHPRERQRKKSINYPQKIVKQNTFIVLLYSPISC